MSKPEPEQSSNLDMVPLQQSDVEDLDDNAPKSATAFFALPQPKRKEPEPEPTPAPAPSGPPPGMPPGMPPGGGMPPGAGGMPPMMGGGMGIQGPVAGGPVAGGQYGMGGGPSLPPPHDDGQDRARSYRVFAVVAGLMLMVCTAIILMGALVVGAAMMGEPEPEPVPTVNTAPEPRPRPVVDTGIKGPKPRPKPKPRSGPAPGPRPTPAPAPAAPAPAPAPPSGPADAVIKIPGSEPFTGVEVTCPISGFRQRATFAGGSATIPGVPQEDCNVIFKGGPPARNTIRGGQTKSCEFPSGQAVCN